MGVDNDPHMEEVSLDEWSKSKPVPMVLSAEDIAAVHDLMLPVVQKLYELGTSYSFSFVTRVDGIGSGQLQSRMGATMGTLTPETWAMSFLVTGGLDNLLDNLDVLVECCNERDANTKTLSLILPSTSIIK